MRWWTLPKSLVLVVSIVLSASVLLNIFLLCTKYKGAAVQRRLNSDSHAGTPAANNGHGVQQTDHNHLLQNSGTTNLSTQPTTNAGHHGATASKPKQDLYAKTHTKGAAQDALVMLFTSIVVGTGVVHLTAFKGLAGLQQTVVLFVLGVFFSMLIEKADLKHRMGVFGRSYEMWMNIDPHLLLFTMLPGLLTGDAMTINTSIAKRVSNQCLYLAGPGVLFNAFLTAGFLVVFLNWGFKLSLVTGSIMCATDPVAVVALLKELGASPELTIQIQGESLLNDGTAIVLYTIAYEMLQGTVYTPEDILIILVQKACVAWLLGMVIGYLFFLWIALAHRLDQKAGIIQISLTLTCAYSSYVMSEGVLDMSGVLATVSAALTLAHNMWPHIASQETMHHVWHTFEFLGNSIIFFLAGSLVGKAAVNISLQDYLNLVIIYLALVVIRGSVIFGSRSVLRWLSADGKRAVSAKDAMVMTWGGLRGAVGLALAIQIYNDKAGGKIENHEAHRVLFFVGGVALLTTIVNATTAPALVNWLGITAMQQAKQTLLLKLHEQLVHHSLEQDHPAEVTKGLRHMLVETESLLHSQRTASGSRTLRGLYKMKRGMEGFTSRGRLLRKNQHKKETNTWEEAQDNSDVVDCFYEERAKFVSIPEKDRQLLGELPPDRFGTQQESQRLICLINDTGIDEGMIRVINAIFLSLVETNYWCQIEKGDLMPGTFESETLIMSTQVAQTWSCDLKDFNFVQHQVQQLAVTYAEPRISLSDVASKPGGFFIFKATETTEFAGLMAFFIATNSIFIYVDMMFHKNSEGEGLGFWFMGQMFFSIVFLTEFLLKFGHERLEYFKCNWNRFDFCMVWIGVCSLLVTVVSKDALKGSRSAQIIRLAKVFRVLRLLRLVRLLKLMKSVRARMHGKSFSNQVAKHMQTIATLTCFASAHLESQAEFVRFFGTPYRASEIKNAITQPDIARCILQSLICVYKAMNMAAQEVLDMDESLLCEVNALRQSRKIAEELQRFVHAAFEAGAISTRERNSIVEPLLAHVSKCAALIKETISGIKQDIPTHTDETHSEQSSAHKESPRSEQATPFAALRWRC